MLAILSQASQQSNNCTNHKAWPCTVHGVPSSGRNSKTRTNHSADNSSDDCADQQADQSSQDGSQQQSYGNHRNRADNKFEHWPSDAY